MWWKEWGGQIRNLLPASKKTSIEKGFQFLQHSAMMLKMMSNDDNKNNLELQLFYRS